MTAKPQRSYWPTTDWQTALPREVGLDPAKLLQMQEYILANVPGLHGLLIVRHGYLAFEQYYQGFHRRSYNSISSATKSVVSMLIGVALARGLVNNLDQHILDFFPDYARAETDTRKHAITLRHLLSLQTGFAHEFPDQYWLNPVHKALARPMKQQPGAQFYYDSQGVDILSGLLTRIAGKNAAAFADATLFKTLGIWLAQNAHFTWKSDPHGAHTWHSDALWDEQSGYLWKVDPQGNSTGSFGAHFTAREMAKLGFLYLNNGSWDGEQLVPSSYVADSTRQQSAGGWPLHLPYGYLWWLTQHSHHRAYFASGFGGKLIYIIPELDLLVVTIASTERARVDHEQDKAITDLIPNFIVPASSA